MLILGWLVSRYWILLLPVSWVILKRSRINIKAAISILTLSDLVAIPLIYAWGTRNSISDRPSNVDVICYALGLSIILYLASGRRIPDGFVPASGRYSARFLGIVGIGFLMISMPIAIELVFGVVARSPAIIVLLIPPALYLAFALNATVNWLADRGSPNQ